MDYAAANAFLDAFALSRNDQMTVVNWGAWRDVGMAARVGSPYPLLQKRLLETPREILYSSRFSLERQWLLSEHMLKTGNALVPGTGYLEMALEAFARGSFRAAEFSNVFFLTPLTFDTSESRDVRVQLRREHADGTERGTFRFAVIARSGIADSSDWIEHAMGLIEPRLNPPASRIDRAIITARCHDREIVFDERSQTRQERYFDFGPRWRSLKRLHIGKEEGLAELELDERFSSDCSTFLLHPALLDMATGCSLYLIDGYDSSDDLYLPFSYKKMCVYRPLPPRCFSHICSRNENLLHGEVATFDITLFDEQGQVVIEIEGFTMRRMEDPAKAAETKNWTTNVALSHAERPIEFAEPPEIAPLDGARALTRLLMSKTPSAIVVLAQPPEELEARSPAPAPLPVTTVPSNGGVEGTLSAWWQEMLGVEHVRLDDDFFELGGHSLIGVRMFAKVKKTYQVDLELSVLFEARTVRQLAAVVRKAKQPATTVSRAWSALVPIQPNGSRVPLFCVHAIGGDVLFYEPLAKALGPDQPFYAFKSPLVAQADIRDTSLEELASVYVKELRAFFPQGPYLLGGASLGGLVVFEMAKMLYAQGIEPGLVMLIDTSVPGSAKRVEVNHRVSTFWHHVRTEGASYLMQKAANKREYWKKLLLERTKSTACSFYRRAGRGLPTTLHLHEVEEAHKKALTHYNFQPYAGKITLMRAVNRGEILSKREDPTLGWGQFAGGGLEIHDVPSGHISMLFEPFVRTFAEILRTILPS